MPNDSLTSILQAICGDDVSARTLLGNPSFLKLCTVLAEQLDERFRQTVLLENAARRPGAYDELDGSSFKNELHEALERDSRIIRVLRNIEKSGGSFCEGTFSDDSDRAAEARGRKKRNEIFRTDDVRGNATQLIVAGGEEAEQATKDLRRWLKNAQVVAICDPYIFHFKAPNNKLPHTLFESDDDYVEFIASLLPAVARHVKFYGAGYTKKIRRH